MGVAILGSEAYHLVLGFLFSLSSLGFGSFLLHLRVSTLVLFIQFCFRVSFRSSLSSSCGFGSFSLSGGLVFRFGSSSCKSS